MTDCKPPAGTPDGTRCVLRRSHTELLARSAGDGDWMFPHWDGGVFIVSGTDMAERDWYFSGICPNLPVRPQPVRPQPVRPQAAQEIAREVLERTANSTGIIVGDDVYSAVVAALRRIAELPE